MPSFEGASEWIIGNAEQSAEAVKGHPTLVHFFSVSCGMCKDNLPRVAEWRDGKREQGLRVVAIHMPRFEADTDVQTVRGVVATYGITEPTAVDNDHKLKDAFLNDHGYVPAYYLFDAEGKLKSFAAGERGLDLSKAALDRMLPGALETAATV